MSKNKIKLDTSNKPLTIEEEIILTAEKIRIFLAHNELGRAPLTYQMAVWHLREVELLKNQVENLTSEITNNKITEAKTI